MAPSDTTVEVFCSYAPEDKAYFQQLEKHLRMLQREGLISLWHHRKILPGFPHADTVEHHLESASLIILLISPDFLASEYYYGVEMQRALERHAAGEARVIPVLLRCIDNWQKAPFGQLAPLPTNTQPVKKWPDKDEAFCDIAAGIRRALADLRQVAVGGAAGQPPGSHPSSTGFPSVWTIPYPRNPFFTGREDLLDQLTRELQKGYVTALSQPQAVSGMGGVGKTQLAIEYAYRHRGHYQAVLWARAESQEALTTSFVALAEALRLPESCQQDAAITVQAVLSWLNRKTDWLLILDSADDLDLVRELLPSMPLGHVLLTTRAQAMGRLARKIEVETFTPEQGACFLLQRATILAQDAPLEQASSQDRELALQITQELGGLPLALDQAGAYMEETGCSLTGYLQLYQCPQTALLKRRGGRTSDHEEPVGTTWLLAFARLESTHPAAADLLRICAFLAPAAIPEGLLTAGASHLGEQLALVAAEPLLLNAAIESLRAYSLLSRDSQTSTLSVHPLVQKVVRDALPTEKQTEWKQRAVTIVNATFPGSDQVSRELWLPHALVCKMWIEQEQMVSPEAANLLRQTGYYLCEHARYTEAEPLYKHCLDIREPSLGCDHPDVAQSLSDLANLYSELGRYEEAVPLCRRCLDIRERSLGCDHPDVARPLNNLAILCKVQGEYEEAERLYRRSLHIWERSLGPEHPDVAQSLNNLAVLYAELGRYAEAEKLFERSRSILERRLGPEHLDVAQSLSNLANLYTEQGKYAEAESLYKRSLGIFELNRRSEHSDAAYPLNGRGNLYKERGRYAEAESLYQGSLCIWEQRLGPKQPQVAYSLHNLAVLYTEQGKYAEAEERDRKYEEAEKLFKRSRDIWEEKLGLKHLHTQRCAKNYARLLHILKRDADALELERQYFFSDELLDELLVLPTFHSFRL